MDRRRFLVTSLAVALAAPPGAHAQPGARMRRIGYLGSTPLTAPEMAPIWKAFVEALRERGWFEGQNIVFERRYAEGRVERFDELAAELGRLRVDVIVAAAHPAAMAARKATTDTPIVMAGVGDAVRYGLVASLAHPRGRVTGVTLITQDVVAKGLELLKDLSPRATHVGFLWNVTLPFSEVIWSDARSAGEQIGLTLSPLEIRRSDDLDIAFAAGVRDRIEALFIRVDPLTLTNRERIVKLALQHRLITMYSAGEFVLAGGLMSYSAPLTSAFRDAARYVDRILRGAKPADLPVEQPSKFELVINAKTAKALGLTIPPSLLARADEVIE